MTTMSPETILRMAKSGVCPVCGGRVRKTSDAFQCTTEGFGMKPCGWTMTRGKK